MARKLCFNFQGEVSELPLARIDRCKLYGSRKRVVCDEAGEPCQTAWLSSDGQTLVPAGGLSQCYLDERGDIVERGDLQVVDEHGEILDRLPSTLGVEHELYGPVAVTRVLDHICTGIYLLEDAGLGGQLAAALDRGEIFEGEFRYTASPQTSTLFLLRNEAGTFGLVCQPVDLPFLQRDLPEDLADDEGDDAEEDLDDDLDFSF